MKVALFFLSFFILSCTEKLKSKQFGLIATGKVGEIMVVCEKGIWDSEIKNYLDTGLTQFIMPYFPDVVTFELIHKSPVQFKNGNKQWRSLLFLEIDPNLKGDKAEITKEIGTWAQSQLVVRIIAKDYNQLVETCKNSLNIVHGLFDEMEWKRLLERYNDETNQQITKQLVKNFGISLVLPNGSNLVSIRNNFYRIEFPTDTKPLEFDGGNGQTVNFIQSGIMVYQYDFIDSSQLTLENLLIARDTMLKYNMPHENPGVYMGTQYTKMIYPEGTFSKNHNNSITGFEMRGMFKFTGNSNYSTGGAFWAFHFINTKKKLVCVSGYVDCPPTISWTYPLRKIQAILKSVVLKND
jgi:hypothetical protein